MSDGLDCLRALPTLAQRLTTVRAQSLALAEPLSEADCQVQSMPDASPVKWHLAHTTWFFETFVLERFEPGFKPHNAVFRVLFNSYYNGVGNQHPRPQRGLITRPTLGEVLGYRRAVEQRVAALLMQPPAGCEAALLELVELGLQHEQQHQELILTDVLHLLSCNPLAPVYVPMKVWPGTSESTRPLGWMESRGGLVDIGHAGDGFAFDNEGPRHRQWLRAYALADRLVTQGEWAEFIHDGGYQDPRWWLSAGWDWVRAQQLQAPLYWQREGAASFSTFSLHGRHTLQASAPVAHLSLYEADAFAHWWSAQHPQQAVSRLPTEFEWEHVAVAHEASGKARGNFVEDQWLRPLPAPLQAEDPAPQLFGDLWQWTRSSYAPYPGFAPWAGAVGEYNAKFMLDQNVLRGGSCASPRSHLRASYRNFFPASARWQFSGMRLARDLS